MQQPPSKRNPLSIWLALVAGLAIVVSTGMLYGHYSQRWGPPARLTAAGKHLISMPSQIESWQMIEEHEMSETALNMLECAGYVNRRYLNQESGQSVNVALIVGPPGPIAVHTPEICYSSRAYQLQTDRIEVATRSSSGESHTFWSVDFKSRNVMADKLRACYAWSLGKRWAASPAPRYEYAAKPLLYKIQLAGSVDADDTSVEDDPCYQFFQSLINSNWTVAESTFELN